MGLVKEIFDEFIPIKPSMGLYTVADFDQKNNIRTEYFKLRYALPNAIFEFLDAIVIPYFTFFLFIDLLQNFSIKSLLIAILPVFSSLFSISQVVYFFIFPYNKYVDFKSRLIGETAIGCLISSIFKVNFKTRIKYKV